MNVTPQQFLRMLARRWPIVLVLALVGALLGWITTPDQAQAEDDTVYRATNVSFIDAGAPTGLTPAQIAFLVTLDEVPVLASEQLDEPPQDLADQVDARYNGELGILEITATNRDPGRAELVADTFAEVLDGYLRGRATDEQSRRRDALVERIDVLEEEIRALDARLPGAGPTDLSIISSERESAVDELRLVREQLQELRSTGDPPSGIRPGRPARAIPYRGSEVIDEALRSVGEPPSEQISSAEDEGDNGDDEEEEAEDGNALVPIENLDDEATDEPDPLIRSGIGGGAGLLVGLGVVALLAVLDKRIRTREDAELAFGLPVLVEVPKLGRKHRDRLVLVDQPTTRVAESYRSLRTSLSLTRLSESTTGGDDVSERDVRVIMVTAPSDGDGATTVAANLAAALAETQLRVLVVDGDFREPRIGDLIDTGIATPLDGASDDAVRADISPFIAESPGLANVWLARSIDPERETPIVPAAMVAAQRALISVARAQFDVIVVDTSPAMSANDARDLVPAVDAVVFAARIGRTSTPDADRTAEQFEQLATPMAGVVVLGSSGKPTARRHVGGQNVRSQDGFAENGHVRDRDRAAHGTT
ncbi:MAG: P-loop NTPase [Acidimicrobiales bacterium]|nr:P-loop NTPase [Acidimicrobiales bacterium]